MLLPMPSTVEKQAFFPFKSANFLNVDEVFTTADTVLARLSWIGTWTSNGFRSSLQNKINTVLKLYTSNNIKECLTITYNFIFQLDSTICK